MLYFRKKQHFPVVSLVLFLRTEMEKLGFFALNSLHPPKFGNCFKPQRFLLGERKRNSSGLWNSCSQVCVEPVPSISQCTSWLCLLVLVLSPCPRGQSRGLKEWSLWGKCHKIPAGIILPPSLPDPWIYKEKSQGQEFFFSQKPRQSAAARDAGFMLVLVIKQMSQRTCREGGSSCLTLVH